VPSGVFERMRQPDTHNIRFNTAVRAGEACKARDGATKPLDAVLHNMRSQRSVISA
jgi:hypothetical protein